MLGLKASGHHVISLSQREGPEINPFLRTQQIDAYSFVVQDSNRWWWTIRHLLYFVSFCRKHQVDVVFSHLDAPNFIAAMGQYLVRAKVFLCNHHVDEAALYGFDRSFSYRLTNRLARKLIVVSARAVDHLTAHEGVPAHKVIHINLGYNFNLYRMPSADGVAKVKAQAGGAVILVTACRLTKYKRPELSLHVTLELVRRGMNVKLFLLGEGDDKANLQEFVEDNALSGSVFMPGHVPNAIDYLAASDFVLHPSLLESSCVVVKEAGLVERPVIVCSGVGDFDAYLQHGHNGFVVEPEKFATEACSLITSTVNDRGRLERMGRQLRDDVLRLFHIDAVLPRYEELIRQGRK